MFYQNTKLGFFHFLNKLQNDFTLTSITQLFLVRSTYNFDTFQAKVSTLDRRGYWFTKSALSGLVSGLIDPCNINSF